MSGPKQVRVGTYQHVRVRMQGGDKVDGVVATQALLLGGIPCRLGHLRCDLDDLHISPERLQRPSAGAKGPGGEPAHASRLSQPRPRLRVQQPARGHLVSIGPGPNCDDGARLRDDQFQEGGCVEVDDHRLWSGTRSLTVASPGSLMGLGTVRGPRVCRGVTSPREMSAVSRSIAVWPWIGTRRATGWP